MVGKLSLLIIILSLAGCGKVGEKDPRMEKILRDRDAEKASNGSDSDLSQAPGATRKPKKDSADRNSDDANDPSDEPSPPTPAKKPSEKEPPATNSGSALGSIANIAFFCSKDSSNQIGTHLQKATGVSIKLYSVSGTVVAENSDVSKAQSRRTSVLGQKSLDVSFSSTVADGLYYLAFCDAAQHTACKIPPDRRGDPINANNGKYSTGIVGFADNVSVSGGKIIAVGKTEALMPAPQNSQEKALCDKVD